MNDPAYIMHSVEECNSTSKALEEELTYAQQQIEFWTSQKAFCALKLGTVMQQREKLCTPG